MKKKYVLLFFIVCFMCLTNVKASLKDYSNGASGEISGLGSGEWYPEFVGLKISIVDEKNRLEDVEIFLNKKTDFLKNNAKLCSTMKPKTHYGSNVDIKWSSKWKDKVYVNSNLPKSWVINGKKVDIHAKLKANKYRLLLEILETKKESGAKVFDTIDNYLSEEHYIIIEPMTYIGGYYGTAFELINAFAGNVSKCSKHFCYWYTGAVFGGDNKRTNGGVLYNTIYVSENVKINNLTIRRPKDWMDKYRIPDSELWKKRNKCMKSRSCGGALGVLSLDKVLPPKSCKQRLKELGDEPDQKKLNELYNYYKKKGKTYNQLLKNRKTEKPKCKNIDPKPGGGDPDPDISCESELSKLEESGKLKASHLLSLYNTLYEKEKIKYKGLLDFENPSCIADGGENKTSCMSANHGNDNEDFSSSKEKESVSIDGENLIIYCKNVFQLSNEQTLEDIVKSGLLFYSGDEDSVAMKGELIQTCYSPKKLSSSSIPFSQYKDLVKDVSIGNYKFISSNPFDSEIKEIQYGGGYLYKKTIITNYSQPEVYAVIGSGEIVKDKNDKKCITIAGDNICEVIGKGFVTNFNETGKKTLEFKYEYSGATYVGNCSLEIVEDPPFANLEFRTIDTSNPFPGKNGAFRKVGNNWCEQKETKEGVVFENCSGISSENNVIDKYITQKNNSYNKTNDGPKYTIILRSNDIDKIRNHNKKTPYDDINLNCKNGYCISNYLTDLQNDGILTIKDSINRTKIKEK